MTYEITSSAKIDFGATGNNAIMQNARFLLSTILNSCPMNRGIGWDPPVDDSTEVAKTQTTAQIVEMYAKYLPEITVEDVLFTTDAETGKVSARVKVVIEDGEVQSSGY